MIKTTIKQQLNNIYELENEKNKKITLKQEKEQKQQVLLNDLNYIIDNVLIALQYDLNDNLYQLYNYYINNKYKLINNILSELKSIKIETLQEIATIQGYEFKKVLINKHNINANNEYQTTLLIDTLLKNKINELIKEHKQQQKNYEYLKNSFSENENEPKDETNKSPPNISIMGLSLFKFLLALIIGICEGLGSTKKRR